MTFTFLFFVQAGVFTGVSSAVVLSMCFGSLAQFFTKDAEVLGIVSSGVLVCTQSYLDFDVLIDAFYLVHVLIGTS